MELHPEVLVANPMVNQEHRLARYEAIAEDHDWYYSCGFSDQCYLVKAERLQKRGIYNEKHLASERFPAYGGELFEKRVDSYMHNHDLRRITSKHAAYIHENHVPVGRTRVVATSGIAEGSSSLSARKASCVWTMA